MNKALEKEWNQLIKQEQKLINKYKNKKDSKLNQYLEDKIPDKLQNTLENAFSKAFSLVFEKGTTFIEKTFYKENIQNEYKINEMSSSLYKNRKALKKFSKNAKKSNNINIGISSFSGIGLGLLGIGLPDIALFVGILFKSIYEIALNYGFEYESDDEKKFILFLIKTSLSNSYDIEKNNSFINEVIENKNKITLSIDECIKDTSKYLSKELLYMKFIQGIPLVGAIGGLYDAIYLKRISKYVEIKYRRRFYYKKIMNK